MSAIRYNGVIEIKQGEPFDGSTLTNTTLLQIKTDNVHIGMNNGIGFLTHFDDMFLVDTNSMYIFSKDCVIAKGELV